VLPVKTCVSRAVCIGAIILLITACAQDRWGGETSLHSIGDTSANKIAVVPFQKVVSRDASATHVRCPLSGAVLNTCDCALNAEKIVRKVFSERLQSYRRYVVIPEERVRGVYTRVSSESFKASPEDILKKVGHELGADWVVVGYVYCYQDRKGFSYSVRRPASVTFCAHLLRVDDGALVWRKIFDKTQTSLMENLLDFSSFVKGGGGWLTAEELTEQGVDKMLATFPGLH